VKKAGDLLQWLKTFDIYDDFYPFIMNIFLSICSDPFHLGRGFGWTLSEKNIIMVSCNQNHPISKLDKSLSR